MLVRSLVSDSEMIFCILLRLRLISLQGRIRWLYLVLRLCLSLGCWCIRRLVRGGSVVLRCGKRDGQIIDTSRKYTGRRVALAWRQCVQIRIVTGRRWHLTIWWRWHAWIWIRRPVNMWAWWVIVRGLHGWRRWSSFPFFLD